MVRNVVFEIDDDFGNFTVLYRIKDRFELHRLIDDVYTISFFDANGNKQKEVVMKQSTSKRGPLGFPLADDIFIKMEIYLYWSIYATTLLTYSGSTLYLPLKPEGFLH